MDTAVGAEAWPSGLQVWKGNRAGAPSVEGEQGAQHAESDEREREPDALLLDGDVVQLGYLEHVHGGGTRTEVDAQDADEQQCGGSHQHQRQLHGGVFLTPAAPHANKEVHGDEGYLVEHEHGEQVDGDKEPEYAQRQEREPQEEFFGKRLQPPRGKRAGEYDDGRQQQHGHRNAVHAYGIVDVECRIPYHVGAEQHFVRSACVAGVEVHHDQRGRQHQQGRGAGYHHRAYLRKVAAEP